VQLERDKNQPPALPPEISTCYLPIEKRGGNGERLVYLPCLYGFSRVRFANAKLKVDLQQNLSYLTPITDEILAVDWTNINPVAINPRDLEKKPEEEAIFRTLPPDAAKVKSYPSWNKSFVDWIYSNEKLEMLVSPSTGILSNPGEDEREFRIRLQQTSREMRDDAVEALRKKYAPKMSMLKERIRRAEQAVEREKEQAKQQGFQTAISLGSTLLGAFTGRKLISKSSIGKATTAVRGASRTASAKQDVERAKDTVESLGQQMEDLQAEFDGEMEQLQKKVDPVTEQLETVVINPRKTDIQVQVFTLAWAPYWQDELGQVIPAYQRD
jgi:hypothetical protein